MLLKHDIEDAFIPKVGNKGYISCGSDCYPVTVTKVSKSGFKVTIRHVDFIGDTAKGHDYYGNQVWKFVDDGNGRVENFYWTPSRNGWYQSSAKLHIGEWHARQDPSF